MSKHINNFFLHNITRNVAVIFYILLVKYEKTKLRFLQSNAIKFALLIYKKIMKDYIANLLFYDSTPNLLYLMSYQS